MIKINYTAGYHNKNQDELQSPYFGHQTHLHPDNNMEWNYNQASHRKGPTIKKKILQEVKSGRIVIDNPKKVSIHPSRLIQSITMLYFPKKDIFKEPAGIENAPYIKDTLDVHKVKRKINDQGIIFLEF